jgi:hypothetical protein
MGGVHVRVEFFNRCPSSRDSLAPLKLTDCRLRSTPDKRSAAASRASTQQPAQPMGRGCCAVIVWSRRLLQSQFVGMCQQPRRRRRARAPPQIRSARRRLASHHAPKKATTVAVVAAATAGGGRGGGGGLQGGGPHLRQRQRFRSLDSQKRTELGVLAERHFRY